MKKLIGICILSAVFILTCNAFADVVNEEWAVLYNGPANRFDASYNIALDSSGNVYVTGQSYYNSTSYGYATVKYDKKGNKEWVARYDASKYTYAFDIAVDDLGNAYVTGQNLGSDTGYDCVTIKYAADATPDADGNITPEWIAVYNGAENSHDSGLALALDSSGNVYVAGSSVGSGTGGDYVTIKYDTDGNEKWVRRYNGTANDFDAPWSIALDSSGNVYVTGQSMGSGTGDDYATIKYDTDGNEKWVQRYNGPADDMDRAADIAVDSSGNCYVTGRSEGSGTGSDYVTIKYDTNGNEKWVKRYNGPGNSYDEAKAISLDSSGNVYVTGESIGSGTIDYATIKYDTNGDQKWVTRYNGPDNDSDKADDIAVDSWGDCYVTGFSKGSGTGYDCVTVKYDTNGNEKWTQRYNGPRNDHDYGIEIVTDNSGNVYVTGRSGGSGAYSDYITIKYSQGIDIIIGSMPIRTDKEVEFYASLPVTECEWTIKDAEGNIIEDVPDEELGHVTRAVFDETGEYNITLTAALGDGTSIGPIVKSFTVYPEVELFGQGGSEPWANHYFGHHDGNGDDNDEKNGSVRSWPGKPDDNWWKTKKSRANIQKYGCSTASLAMVASYLIERYNLSSAVHAPYFPYGVYVNNPGRLNALLRGSGLRTRTKDDIDWVVSNGYSMYRLSSAGNSYKPGTDLHFEEIRNWSFEESSGEPSALRIHCTSKREGTFKTYQKEIDRLLELGNPVIVRIRNDKHPSGHYLVITHKAVSPAGSEKYYVNDPGDAKREPGSIYLEDTGDIIAFKIIECKDNPQSSQYMDLRLNCPAHMIITDEGGNQTGFDPDSGQLFSEIPNATYDVEQKRFWLEPMETGDYTVEVKPVEEGYYKLNCIVNRENGTTYNTSFDRYLPEGQEHSFNLNNPQDPEQPVSVGITDTAASLMSLEGYPQSITLVAIGARGRISVTGTLTDDSIQDLTSSGTGTIYTSSNESVVTVSSEGIITAVGSGETVITVNNSGFSDTVSIKVIIPVSIEITPKQAELDRSGDTQQLTVTANYSDGSTQNIGSILDGTLYTSSDETKATVTIDGLISAVGKGQTTITATNGELSDTCEVTVNIEPSTLCNINITPREMLLTDRLRYQLKVEAFYGTPQEGSVEDITSSEAGTTYTINDESIAAVSADGLITAKVPAGTATIVAANGEFSDSCELTISLPPVFANFLGRPLSGQPPLVVDFSDNSGFEITDWHWDFGDGQTSQEQNPYHIYNELGKYTVSLTASGPDGSDTETKTDYINVSEAVNNPPVAKAKDVTVYADENGRANASVDDGSFDPDPGDTITLTQTPPGPYELGQTSVTLTVTDSYGATDTDTANVTVLDNQEPVVALNSPEEKTYYNTERTIAIDYTVKDNCDPAPEIEITLDGQAVSDSIDISNLAFGHHTLNITARDNSGNIGTDSVIFDLQPEPMTMSIKCLSVDWHYDKNRLMAMWAKWLKYHGKGGPNRSYFGWLHNRCRFRNGSLKVTGNLELPEAYNIPNDLTPEVTVKVEIGGVLGKDTVSMKRKQNRWEYRQNKRGNNSINLGIKKLNIMWSSYRRNGKREVRFSFDADIFNMVNDSTGAVTVTLLIPVRACGDIAGTQTVTCEVYKLHWRYPVQNGKDIE